MLRAHSPVEGRGIRVCVDHQAISTITRCLTCCPNKESPSNAAAQRGGFDKQLEQICFTSDYFDLRNTNDFAVLFCNRNQR